MKPCAVKPLRHRVDVLLRRPETIGELLRREPLMVAGRGRILLVAYQLIQGGLIAQCQCRFHVQRREGFA